MNYAARLSFLILPLSLAACGGGGDSTDPAAANTQNQPLTFGSLVAKVDCASLQGSTISSDDIGLPVGSVTIITAMPVAAAASVRDAPRGVPHDQVPMPAYCKVVGAIKPVDPTAPDVNFQVNLPNDWNQKAAQLGGTGLNGTIVPALTSHYSAPESQPAGVGSPLARGFVELGSDGGHQTGTSWYLNAESMTNLYYGSLKKTHDVAMALTKKYYGSAPKLMYFLGSSQGGREALTMAQKFPEDYDGIFSQVPIIGTTGLWVHPTLLAQQQTGAGWIPPAKVAIISNEVQRQCDALDGVADGVVSNFERCNAIFRNIRSTAPTPWAKIRCASGTDEGVACLSDAQIVALQSMHSVQDVGFNMAYGAPLYAGWPVGAETGAQGWINFPTRPDATYNGGAAGTWMAAVIMGDLAAQVMTFNPTTYKDKLIAASKDLDGTNPDLSKFMARGGKLVLKSNTGDYSQSYLEHIRYYKQVVSTMGQGNVDSFLRYYVAPGLGHSMNFNSTHRGVYGDIIPSQFDALGVLDGWVAGKKTPDDKIVLEQRDLLQPYALTASKPMCRYPSYPQYTGGSRSDQASYSCTGN